MSSAAVVDSRDPFSRGHLYVKVLSSSQRHLSGNSGHFFLLHVLWYTSCEICHRLNGPNVPRYNHLDVYIGGLLPLLFPCILCQARQKRTFSWRHTDKLVICESVFPVKLGTDLLISQNWWVAPVFLVVRERSEDALSLHPVTNEAKICPFFGFSHLFSAYNNNFKHFALFRSTPWLMKHNLV